MNRLIIVGNGFDLATGIESSYSSFILWYLKDCLSKANRSNESNLFLFKNINESSVKIVVENSTSLKDFLLFIKANDIKYEVEEERLSFLEKIIEDNLEQKWVDIESLYFDSLLRIKESKYDEKVKKGLIVKLNQQLKVLESKLCEYLSQQVKEKRKIDDEYFYNVKRMFFCEDLIKLNFGDGDFIKHNTLILNFNYTNLTEEWIKEQNNTSQINIHGELKNQENKIIFGYGNNQHPKYLEIEQLNDDDYLKNIKSMSYPLTSNYSKLMSFLNTGKINSDSGIEHSTDFEVLIYGHSCGLSDSILLREILQHKNCKSIHIAYYENQNDYQTKTIQISRHFDRKNECTNKQQPFNKKLKIPQLKKDEKMIKQ